MIPASSVLGTAKLRLNLDTCYTSGAVGTFKNRCHIAVRPLHVSVLVYRQSCDSPRYLAIPPSSQNCNLWSNPSFNVLITFSYTSYYTQL